MALSGKRWTKIDDRFIADLWLDKSDYCFFYLERTPGGYSASDANQRIKNFKHELKYKDSPVVWGYKQRAIREFASDVCNLLESEAFQSIFMQYPDTVLVPMPTHHPKSHELYDSRLVDMCNIVASRVKTLRVEDVFDIRREITPSHAGGSRDIFSLRSEIKLAEFSKRPDLVILVDDVLTSGAHYVVCRDKVRNVYQDVPIIGVFLAKQRNDIGYGSVEF